MSGGTERRTGSRGRPLPPPSGRSRAAPAPHADGRPSRAESPSAKAARCVVLVCCAVTVTLLWTFWWHLGSVVRDATIVSDSMSFLSWTFVPCTAIAVVLAALVVRRTRGRAPWHRAMSAAGVTLVSPVLWAVGYCSYYDDLAYLPQAGLVAETAWIATLQPLWALLITQVLVGRPEPASTPARP